MCCLEIQYSVENYGFQTISFGVDKNSILEKKTIKNCHTGSNTLKGVASFRLTSRTQHCVPIRSMWLQTGVTYQKLESPDRVDPTKTNILLIRSMNWTPRF